MLRQPIQQRYEVGLLWPFQQLCLVHHWPANLEIHQEGELALLPHHHRSP